MSGPSRKPAPERGADRWMLALLLVAGLSVQLMYWLADGTAVRYTGKDDELYVYQGYQVAGLTGEKPIFNMRPPGVSMLIAACLRAFGYRNIWTVGLLLRVILAACPVLYYLLLRQATGRPLAAVASSLSLFLGYNERAGNLDSDRVYAAFGLLSIGLAWLALRRTGEAEEAVGGKPGWLASSAAGLALCFRTMLRSTGLFFAIVFGLAASLLWGGSRKQQAKLLAIVVGPSIAFIIGLGVYHAALLGTWGLPAPTQMVVPGLYAIADCPIVVPDSPEVEQLLRTLPEARREDLVSIEADWFVAQYRLVQRGGMEPFEYQKLQEKVTRQYMLSNPRAVASRALNWSVVLLLYGMPECVLEKFAGWNRLMAGHQERLAHRVWGEPYPRYPLQGTGVLGELSGEIGERLHSEMRWAAFDASHLLGRTQRENRFEKGFGRDWADPFAFPLWVFNGVRHALSLRRIADAFAWGWLGVVSIALLCCSRRTRRWGILLAAAAIAEFAPIALAAGPTWRYCIYLQPIWYLGVWLMFGSLVRLDSHTSPAGDGGASKAQTEIARHNEAGVRETEELPKNASAE